MAEIKWHDSAREHLRKIFNFNIDHFSESYAYSILGEVLDEVQDLENFPQKGAPELLLEGREYEYRRLVIREKYKVIYFLVDDEAHIAAVWDVRRDPKTLIQLVVDGEK
ncbi:MAG: type II toxin-antitoxin system RelE/ParE family toxin [Paludibacteraceae bacterium]|nr:type II toxin-antitoxin system RelE/ParE family toxin [Paludibacteraceae bacterium]